MKTSSTSRRKSLATGTSFVSAPLLDSEAATNSPAGIAAAKEFLSKWERAWNMHNAHQLCLLHTIDANTVNRFGTLVKGREALEKALGFLHGVGGPFHAVAAPPLHLIDLRQITPNVMILQASWQSPEMNPDGKLDPTKQNDMIVSYALLRDGGDWRATQVDLHNIDKMDLPFSDVDQKP
jgi:hypothetical protein